MARPSVSVMLRSWDIRVGTTGEMVLDAARRAEDLGLDGLIAGDHVTFYGYGNDGLVTLTAAVFIGPFFFLSGLGGQLADRFDKSIMARNGSRSAAKRSGSPSSAPSAWTSASIVATDARSGSFRMRYSLGEPGTKA